MVPRPDVRPRAGVRLLYQLRSLGELHLTTSRTGLDTRWQHCVVVFIYEGERARAQS